MSEEEEPKTLQEFFESYADYCLPGAPPDDIRILRMKQAFYRGAQVMLIMIGNIGDNFGKKQDLLMEMNNWIDEQEKEVMSPPKTKIKLVSRIQ